jgi:alanine racemase
VRRNDRYRNEPAGAWPNELGSLDGLSIETLHSHLACADEDNEMNECQLRAFREAAAHVPAKRYSDRQFGRHLPRARLQLRSRPAGAALYGGIPRREAQGEHPAGRHGRGAGRAAANDRAGESCGYGATFVARADTEAAIVNIGYADGYLRGFSSSGSAFAGEFRAAGARAGIDGPDSARLRAAPGLKEGDWVELDYDLPSASQASGLSQYELLTTAGLAVRAGLDLVFGGGVLGS